VITREQSDKLWELGRDMRATARHLENVSPTRDREEYNAAHEADRAALTAFVEGLYEVTQ
jgi:hypothetical protein